MKKIITILLISFLWSSLSAQPVKFSWRNLNKISDPKDQGLQGTCAVFSSVAAVEAIISIYYNRDALLTKLSESSIYNGGPEYYCLGTSCDNSQDVVQTLNFIKNTGVVDNESYPYPINQQDEDDYCRKDCQQIFNPEYYNQLIKIFHYDTIQISNNNNTKLKKAIMDYGPIIANLSGLYDGHYVGYYLHPGDDDKDHVVLITGWNAESGLKWEIKDSWPGAPSISEVDINPFNFNPVFTRVFAIYNGNAISCQGQDCSPVFDSIYWDDQDEDGFYSWGFDSTAKPDYCPGTVFMDFNDFNENLIFRDGYDILPAPSLAEDVDYVCDDGDYFLLQNVPDGFSVHWTLTNGQYFSSSSGNSNPAFVNPVPGNIGKKAKIIFTISYNGEEADIEYEDEFIINGPDENQVSISVIDGYGGSPPKYGGIYYLCPNSTYYIYYYNSDGNCTTSNYDWDLPYGWTEYWSYNNCVAINTNNYPEGRLGIDAYTCCQTSPDPRVEVYVQYFYEDDCGGYFRAFPNPSDDFVSIDIIKEKMTAEELRSDTECTVTIIDKSGTTKYQTKFKGFPYEMDTSNLPEGLYFLHINFLEKKSTIRLVVER